MVSDLLNMFCAHSHAALSGSAKGSIVGRILRSRTSSTTRVSGPETAIRCGWKLVLRPTAQSYVHLGQLPLDASGAIIGAGDVELGRPERR